jgi:hypothetical protein
VFEVFMHVSVDAIVVDLVLRKVVGEGVHCAVGEYHDSLLRLPAEVYLLTPNATQRNAFRE